MTCRIAVLVSGFGSNLQALIDACNAGRIPGQIVCVLSNKQAAYGLQRARDATIPAIWLDPADYVHREQYDNALLEQLALHQVDVVILAGFMRILSPPFIQRFKGKMLNIHPSLLPKYPGLHTHQRALDAGDSQHGCSVHFVTETLDGGPVVLQAQVPIKADDDADSLAARVHLQEHCIYPQATAWLASGRLQLKDGQAWLDGQHLPQQGVVSSYDND